jgi:hypothetical protein
VAGRGADFNDPAVAALHHVAAGGLAGEADACSSSSTLRFSTGSASGAGWTARAPAWTRPFRGWTPAGRLRGHGQQDARPRLAAGLAGPATVAAGASGGGQAARRPPQLRAGPVGTGRPARLWGLRPAPAALPARLPPPARPAGRRRRRPRPPLALGRPTPRRPGRRVRHPARARLHRRAGALIATLAELYQNPARRAPHPT